MNCWLRLYLISLGVREACGEIVGCSWLVVVLPFLNVSFGAKNWGIQKKRSRTWFSV
jgi:hypothetical protein